MPKSMVILLMFVAGGAAAAASAVFIVSHCLTNRHLFDSASAQFYCYSNQHFKQNDISSQASTNEEYFIQHVQMLNDTIVLYHITTNTK